MQLKDLLETNIIADDFPLLDKTRQHKLSGLARIAIWTSAYTCGLLFWAKIQTRGTQSIS